MNDAIEAVMAFCFILGWVVASVGMIVHLGLFLLDKTTMMGPWWWLAFIGLLLMNVGGLLTAMVGES